jgi:hypothetical protein
VKVEWLIVHHIGTMPAGFPVENPVPTVRGWHVNGNKWSDIGYHKVISPSGTVHQGRADAVIGAHAFGANAASLGILMVGDFSKAPPTEAHLRSLVQVLATLAKRHKISLKNIIGHRDVAKLFPGGAASACPGDALYALLPEIRRRVGDYLD